MIYLYTTKPDEGCHEVVKGVYGRPVQSSQINSLVAKGWVTHVDKLSEAKEEESTEEKVDRDALATSLGIDLYDEEGKKLHYKLIDSAIKEKQANEHNEG